MQLVPARQDAFANSNPEFSPGLQIRAGRGYLCPINSFPPKGLFLYRGAERQAR